jgi:hypothetical protein
MEVLPPMFLRQKLTLSAIILRLDGGNRIQESEAFGVMEVEL